MSIGAKIGRSSGRMVKVLLFFLGLGLAAASVANATSTDLFIRFDGIKGGSTVENYEDWNEVMSVHWGLSVEASLHGAGKPILEDLSWGQLLDISFNPLVTKAITGAHLNEVLA